MARYSLDRPLLERGNTLPYGDNDNVSMISEEPLKLERTHSRLSMLGLGFAILNSWTALSASLSIALPSGGPSAVLWGLVISGICNACLAASLAEFLSAYPTAGGQYHWVAQIAPPSYRRVLSWSTGFINVCGWIFLTATGGSLGQSMIFNLVRYIKTTYEPSDLAIFVVYTAVTLGAFTINTFFTRLLPALTKFAMLWSVVGIITTTTVLLFYRLSASDTVPLTPASTVFFGFTNTTGYIASLAWALGLLQGSLALIGYDAVAHMVEELPNPTHSAPRVMVESVFVGCISGFIFCAVLLFCATSIPQLIVSPHGPLLTLFAQATQSPSVVLGLTLFPLGCLVFATTGIMATASRTVYAFARDSGLPGSETLARIHPTLHTPLNALILTVAVVEAMGLLYFVSTAALNALIAAAVVVLSVSYALPVVLHMLARREALPRDRPFMVPGRWGWACNIIGAGFVIVECALFVLPPTWPWKLEDANWCIVVLGAAAAVAAVDWKGTGRKTSYVLPAGWKEGQGEDERGREGCPE